MTSLSLLAGRTVIIFFLDTGKQVQCIEKESQLYKMLDKQSISNLQYT